ncbi:hypothetical protein [Photobacterium kasasachensis]|uniref:hypothetical protein n=1 Tax=Photobacterium kasasachensis TaxID=2910240 RepID=UPI003D11E0DE
MAYAKNQTLILSRKRKKTANNSDQQEDLAQNTKLAVGETVLRLEPRIKNDTKHSTKHIDAYKGDL